MTGGPFTLMISSSGMSPTTSTSPHARACRHHPPAPHPVKHPSSSTVVIVAVIARRRHCPHPPSRWVHTIRAQGTVRGSALRWRARRRGGEALAAGWHLSQGVGVAVVHHVEATIHVHAHRPIVAALLRVVAQHAREVPADGTWLIAPSIVPAPDPRSSSPSGRLDATESALGDHLSTRSMHGGRSAAERRTMA